MAATGASDTDPLSAAALLAAAGALATGVGSLAATGLLGQVERDHPVTFSIALGLTVGGTFLAALATSGLLGGTSTDIASANAAEINAKGAARDPARASGDVTRADPGPRTALAKRQGGHGRPASFRAWWHRRGVSIVRAFGAVAICAGVILGALVAIETARDNAKPIIDVSITPVKLPGNDSAATRTYLVDAETKANKLPANARITILVDGLHFDPASATYAPTNVFQGKYGPNNDGVVNIHSTVELTRGRTNEGTDFDAVGVQASVAYSEQKAESNPCGEYAKQVSTPAPNQAEARARLDPGCVVVRLPTRVTPEEATTDGNKHAGAG
jgi:hypothetical protein